MENLKTPLTWVLGIVCVGYLFIANCECGEESTCLLNNGFNIDNAGMNNGFNISSADLNNGFNISNAGLNGEVLKVDAPETVEEDLGDGLEVLNEIIAEIEEEEGNAEDVEE